MGTPVRLVTIPVVNHEEEKQSTLLKLFYLKKKTTFVVAHENPKQNAT